MKQDQIVYEMADGYKRIGVSALVLFGLGWISPFAFFLFTAYLVVLPIVFLCPSKVVLTGSNTLRLNYLLKTKTLDPADITKIQDHVFHYTIHYAHGRIRISTLMNDAYGLMRNLLSINPKITIQK